MPDWNALLLLHHLRVLVRRDSCADFERRHHRRPPGCSVRVQRQTDTGLTDDHVDVLPRSRVRDSASSHVGLPVHLSGRRHDARRAHRSWDGWRVTSLTPDLVAVTALTKRSSLSELEVRSERVPELVPTDAPDARRPACSVKRDFDGLRGDRCGVGSIEHAFAT